MTKEPKFDEPAAVATLADLHAYGTAQIARGRGRIGVGSTELHEGCLSK